MAQKANDRVRYFENPNSPVIGMVSRDVIEQDGLCFKDLDGSRELTPVNADGVCVSPNDVPGYDKDMYIPDALKDENGKAYAYWDSAGNYYALSFGLSY